MKKTIKIANSTCIYVCLTLTVWQIQLDTIA